MSETMPMVGSLQAAAALLDRKKPDLAEMLPEGMSVDRFVRLVMTEINDKPKLLGCNQVSLYGEVCKAAAAGLEIGKTFGQFYLVPFGNTCQGIVGYKGMAALAMRHPDVLKVQAEVVYKGDHFLHDTVAEVLEHRIDPHVDRTNNALIIGAWAMVTQRNGVKHIVYKSVAEIEQRRKRSRAAADGPWVTDYPAMCRKTVLRVLLWGGTVPMSTKAAEFIEQEVQEETKTVAHVEVESRPLQAAPVTMTPPQTHQGAKVVERGGLGEPPVEKKVKKTKEKAPEPKREEPGAGDDAPSLPPGVLAPGVRPRATPDASELDATPAATLSFDPEPAPPTPELPEDPTVFELAFGPDVHTKRDFDLAFLDQPCSLMFQGLDPTKSFAWNAANCSDAMNQALKDARARGLPVFRDRHDSDAKGWNISELRAYLALKNAKKLAAT